MRVGIRELKVKTSLNHDEALALLADMEQLAAKIGAKDLPPVDTTILMHEERRSLECY